MNKLEEKKKFIELRAKGFTYLDIASKLKKTPETLVSWNKELKAEVENARQIELEALHDEFLLTQSKRIKHFGIILQKITTELNERDFTKISTARLLELYLAYYDKLTQEVNEIELKTTSEIEGAKDEQRTLKAYLEAEDNLNKTSPEPILLKA
jgi:transcriptional regulator